MRPRALPSGSCLICAWRGGLEGPTVCDLDLEACVLLATLPVFFLATAWIFLSYNEFVGLEAPVLRALLPKFSCPQRPPSCPHRTVAAEVRKQVSRERSGSPHSSRRCSSSLGVSVWEVPLTLPLTEACAVV